MVKTLRRVTGSVLDTALVVFGWVSFTVSFITDDAVTTFVLRAIARVLPQASWDLAHA